MYIPSENNLKIPIKGLLIAIIMLFAASTNQVFPQNVNVVTISSQVLPPYNVPLDQLKDNLRATIYSSGTTRIFLTLSITGDNGISIQSNNASIDYISLTGGIPLTMPDRAYNFDNLFLQNNLTFNGVNPASVYQNGLPPGNYQVCLRAWYTESSPATDPAPIGCSSISIIPPSVNIQVIEKPPFTPNFYNLEDNTFATVQSTQTTSIRLKVQIKGDNGVTIATDPNFMPSSYIDLQANVPLTLTASDLYLYFNPENMVFSGIRKEEVQQSGLPEGHYRVCMQAYSPDGQMLSADDPRGCSNQFEIRFLDPPMIISPVCGKEFTNTGLQSIVFSWTPSPGAPAGTPYTLRIVEITDTTVPPPDALQTATTPAFFEKTVFGTTSVFYGPAQPVLEEGRSYAFQVIAGTESLDRQVDFTGSVRFKNGGKSEPCYFKWGKNEFVNPVMFTQSSEPEVTPITPNTNILPYTTVKGKLRYKFKGISTVLVAQTGTSGMQVNTATNTLREEEPRDKFKNTAIDPAGSKPLAGVRVSLEVKYVLIGKMGKQQVSQKVLSRKDFPNSSDAAFNDAFADDGKILTTTVTDDEGNFSFTFPLSDTTLGKVTQNFKYDAGAVEFSDHASGMLYKTTRLIVDNNYYCSPDNNIDTKPWEVTDLGTLVSYVKSYNLAVTVSSTNSTFYDQGGNGRGLREVAVQIKRAEAIPYVPSNEGNAPGGMLLFPGQKKIIADANTKADTFVIIRDLVMHDPDNTHDRYYVSCKTPKTDGAINYKTRERKYAPIYLNDRKKFPFNHLVTETYQSSGGGYNLPQTVTYGSDVVFNSDFKVKVYNFTMELYPDKPRIYGTLMAHYKDYINYMNTLNDSTLSHVKLLLFSQWDHAENIPSGMQHYGTLTIENTYSNKFGFYQFNKLPLELDASTFNKENNYMMTVTGPARWMVVKPKGFGLKEYPSSTGNLLRLKWGQQIKHDFDFEPDGLAIGYVVDDEGNPVPADIRIGDNPANSTGLFDLGSGLSLLFADYAQNKQTTLDLSSMPAGSQAFGFRAQSGTQKIVILPHADGQYMPLTSTIEVAKMDDNQTKKPGKYVVMTRKHRVKFRVVAPKSNSQTSSGGLFFLTSDAYKPIPNTKVKIKGLVNEISGTTGPDGYVILEFMNSDSSFTLDVTPPEESDYCSTEYSFTSNPGGTVIYKGMIVVPPALSVSGKVTLGDENEPVKGAQVYIAGEKKLHALTDDKGRFTISKIPANHSVVTIKADKDTTGLTIIGDTKENIKLPVKGLIALHLTVNNQIVVQDLFGFPVFVDELELHKDYALVSGTFKDLKNSLSNDNFTLNTDDGFKLGFYKVKVVAGKNGGPATVDQPSVETDADQLPVIINKAFTGTLKPESGSLIRILPDKDKQGVMKGKISINKNSFNFNAAVFSFEDNEVALKQQGASSAVINAFYAPGADYNEQNFNLSNGSGGDLDILLRKFKGKATQSLSYLAKDTIHLAAKLTTNDLPGMNPSKISLALSNVKITPHGLQPVSGTSTLSFTLDKWKVNCENWKLTEQSKGFEIEKGTLKTGVVDMPVKEINLTPDNFEINQIQPQQMSIAGVAPLKIKTTDVSFGYLPHIGKDQQGHWRLALVGLNNKPAASLANLPGMEAGKELNFQSFAILSNGEQNLSLTDDTQEITFYKVLKVKPLAIYPYETYFTLQGNMDLGIPRIKQQMGIIKFTRSNNALKFALEPLNMNFDGPGHVSFYAGQNMGDQQFSEGVFSATGTIKDEEGIVLKGKLHRNVSGAWLEVDPLGQKLAIGSSNTTYFSDVKGEMRVDNSKNDWGLFSFNGVMNGVKGMEGDKRKFFTIHGDITADDQQVQVKNFDSGFGNINITYDFQHSRLTGDLHINQNLGGFTMQGMANLLVDNNGWYFVAGGDVTLPGIGNLQAGILIGDYGLMPPDLSQKIMQYAYNKNIPTAFQNHVSGMFLTGRKSLPIIDIPDVNINLWVVSARLGVEAGLDARMWMGFDKTGAEFGIGAMAFAHAYFIASSITCTNLSADARAELGATGMYNTGTGTFSIGGCGSFSLAARVEQCLGAFGVCGPCIGVTLQKSVKVDILLDSSGNTDLSFGFGNCSGSSTLTNDF